MCIHGYTCVYTCVYNSIDVYLHVHVRTCRIVCLHSGDFSSRADTPCVPQKCEFQTLSFRKHSTCSACFPGRGLHCDAMKVPSALMFTIVGSFESHLHLVSTGMTGKPRVFQICFSCELSVCDSALMWKHQQTLAQISPKQLMISHKRERMPRSKVIVL